MTGGDIMAVNAVPIGTRAALTNFRAYNSEQLVWGIRQPLKATSLKRPIPGYPGPLNHLGWTY